VALHPPVDAPADSQARAPAACLWDDDQTARLAHMPRGPRCVSPRTACVSVSSLGEKPSSACPQWHPDRAGPRRA